MEWTDQETTTLINLWPVSSAAQIAARLSRSRSAVCRKAQALHLDGSHKHFTVPPRKIGQTPRIPKSRLRTIQRKPLPSIDDGLAMAPCSLLELTDRRCHWPIGNVNAVAMMFCGGDVVPGQRYCPHHARMAAKG
jgi:GcrA cell cycle regulator